MAVRWVDEIRDRFAQRRRACRQMGCLYGHRATSLSLRGFGVHTIAPISPLVAYKCGSGEDTRRQKCFFYCGTPLLSILSRPSFPQEAHRNHKATASTPCLHAVHRFFQEPIANISGKIFRLAHVHSSPPITHALFAAVRCIAL